MLKVDLKLSFKDFKLPVQFSLKAGRTLGLYGPSGIGKSSLLHAIAGINRRFEGSIFYQMEAWDGKSKHIPAQKRSAALMFQDYALFPNLNVEKNIKFNTVLSANEITEIIEQLELSKLLDRSVQNLSGGQKQRVALARLIAYDAQVWLLDEPFSALDSELKSKVKGFLKELIISKSKIVLISSHDREDLHYFDAEILELA